VKLAIIGDTRHSWDAAGRLCTLSPVVRQLTPWLERFDRAIFCGTLAPGPPPPTHEPYPVQTVELRVLEPGGGSTLGKKAGLLRLMRRWWPVLRRTMRECDVVHLRCPCSVALTALLAMSGLPIRRHAMYAGAWGGFAGESPFYRLQRRWLNGSRFGGIVAVYGSWPRQPDHVVTSFSPSFTLAEWVAGSSRVERKTAAYRRVERVQPLRAVSVGHLNADKNQVSILQAVAALRAEGVAVELELLGDGPERPRLEAAVRGLDLSRQVTIRGRVPLSEVREAYLSAHVGILASVSEGFPKVLAEAMAAGAAPVASDVGINGQILGGGERGLLFPFNDHAALAGRLREIAGSPDTLRRMALAGREYTREITLDAFAAMQHRILTERLGVADRRPVREEVPA
jgi:glycosyltransferase involved in cell wall biosynthesis